MANKLNTFAAGLITGIIGPAFGFLIYGFYFVEKYRINMQYFFTDVFVGTKEYQSPIATLSLLFNLALFFLFLRLNWENAAKGVLGATMIYAPIIVFLFFY